MKTTRYFEEQALRKRPDIRREWCRDGLAAPSDAKSRRMAAFAIGGLIREASRFLRVVTLDDGETVHNAFFGRNFRPEAS